MADELDAGRGKLLDKLNAAFERMTTLDITTAIGEATKNPATGRYEPAAGSKLLYTSIDLVGGDILNIVPTDFGEGADDALRAFHQSQVGAAQATVKANLEAVEKLIALATGKA